MSRPHLVALVMLAVVSLAATACSTGSSGPRVDGAVPHNANATGNTFVLIQGDNFAPNAQVRLGRSQLVGLTWVNARLLTAEVPGGMQPGAYDLTVANPGGGTKTLPAAITITGPKSAPPAAATVAPAAATQPSAATAVPATGTPQPELATVAPSPRPLPATISPAPSPQPRTAEPTQQPSATEAPPPAPRATQPPPRATQPPLRPTQPPTQPPARATQPAALPQSRTAAVPNLAGQWTIVDTVTYGPGAGGTYSFAVTIRQSGANISGSGSGIRFNGVIDGDLVHATYVQDNGAGGSFEWATDAGGTALSGSFTNSIGNGGDSYGQRSGSGIVASFAAVAAQGQDDATEKSHGKKKGR